MLYFIFVWTILIFICLTIGTAILNLVQANHLTRKGDRFILSIWLGIISLTLLFLTVSFILPLSSLVGLSASLILIIISFFFRKNRQEIKSLLTSLNLKNISLYLFIAIIISAFASQKVIWFDTGVYHWGSIKWLSEFGTVFGVGLINSKFGFNAGWFAFSAPLHFSVLKSHIGAIGNGFLLFLVVTHFLIALKHLLSRQLLISDGFVLTYFGTILPFYIVTSFDNSRILISFAPDIPVNFLIGVIAWTILLISNTQIPSNKYEGNHCFSSQLIPLFLSLGTISMKLSALPLFPITFLFSLSIKSNQSRKIKRFIISSFLSILLLMPMFMYGIKTTGCPLYPSSLMCINLPWSIDKAVVKEEKNIITGIATTPTKSSENYFLLLVNSRFQWLKSSIKLQFLFLLIIPSVIFSLILIKNKNHILLFKGYSWLLGLGFLGISFIMIQSPILRFGLGYFCLIPSLFIAIFLIQKLANINYLNNLSSQTNKLFFLSIIIFISVILIFDDSIEKRLLLPLGLPEIEVIKAQINDIKYVYPDNSEDKWEIPCWDQKLPCSPLPIQENIRLKNPEKGIGGGFLNEKIKTE
jgi:hypothetical protein